MLELDEDFELPIDKPIKPVMDRTIANEQAFYTTNSGGEAGTQDAIRIDLENSGVNEFHSAANEAWRNLQEEQDNNIVLDVMQDSSISLEDKATLLKRHTIGTFASTNIRDKFIQDTASTDVLSVDKIDVPLREQDIEAQDLYIETVESRKAAHSEVQRAQAEWGASLDGSLSDVLGGILLDFSPLALPNFRNLAAAKEAGLELDVSSSGSPTADFVSNLAASFLATGSVDRKVADAFRDAPPEQQLQIFKDVVEGLEKVPGTDFNKFIAIQELIEQPLNSDILTGGRNLLSLLEAHPLGQLVTNPIRTIKWYTTFASKSKINADDIIDEADFLSRGVPDEFGAGVAKDATVFTDKAGNRAVQLDTFLPNHNAILPAPKPKRNTTSTPESAAPNNATIILDDKTLKQEFPTRHPDIETEFAQPSTGSAKGNFTDTPLGVDDAENLITAERVAEDFVAGQNFGEQQAARDLLKLAKGVPTAKNNQVFIDELWQAAGGADVIPLTEFKKILRDLNDKGSIKLARSAEVISITKENAASIIGRNDERFDTLSFDIPKKRTIADDTVDEFDTFGNNLSTEAKIDKILARSSEVPEEILKRRVSKVYSSSFENKQAGMALVRVNSAKFDKVFSASPSYVGANGAGGQSKKYNDFKEFFEETKNIEVGSVKVAKDGAVSFIDGKHRHAVLRDSGIKQIPVSMDAASIINAQRHGLLEGVAKENTKRKVNSQLPAITRSVPPDVQANSPAGTLALSNPVAASNTGVDILSDVEGDIAGKMGTTRAGVYGQWVLPKIQKSVIEQFPNVANKLKILDTEFEKAFREGSFDTNITPVNELNAEVDLVVDTLRQIKNVTYQQANSTLDFGRDQAHGLAQYGRTDDYGWNSLDDASDAFDQVQGANPNFPTRIIQKDTQFFIEQEWEAGFNHLDRFMFGLDSLQANFLGIDVSSVARSKLGDIFIPFTMSDKADLDRTGGAFLNEIKANKIEQQFLRTVNQVILDRAMPTNELHTELNKVQESQEWLSVGQLAQANAHLKPKKFEKLVQGYEAYKRLSDYNYEWVNRIDRNNALDAGHKGIYNENGQLVGLGSDKFPQEKLTDGSIREVWSYEQNQSVPLPKELEGREILLARGPIRNEKRETHRFVMLEGKYEKGLLPSRTLPRTEGWVARKNVENWYIDSVPRSAKIDGISHEGGSDVSKQILRGLKRTIGAGMTKPEVEKLLSKLSKEDRFINEALEIRRADENVGSATVSDYTFFANTVRSSKKRGERLITLNGKSHLEDPVQALAASTRNAVQIQVHDDYVSEYKKSWMNKFSGFTDGTFPTHPSQIQPKEAMTELELKEIKAAQTLFRYIENLNKFSTTGDDLWANFWHKTGDVLENITIGGSEAAQASRQLARKGNLAVRFPKSVATNLFIHTNPLRQWMIQPQQLIELNLIMPEYGKQSALDIPAMITALLSRADIIPSAGDNILYNTSRTLSGMSNNEFDEVFNAFWDTGLAQAIDMNSVLLGAMHDGKFNLNPTKLEAALQRLSTVVKAPGILGKNIGFGPAEMANIVGTWLFTRQRFIKNNPSDNWNTPSNLNTITKQAWDISHSMIGNAGSAPWQKGAIGLFLQFAAVQHKGLTQTLMSKTLTPAERTKLTATRLAVYGMHGVPFLAVSAGAIVNEFGSDEFKKEFPKMQGGFADIGTNALTDIWLQDPAKPSDFNISLAITPLPETHPFIELFIEGKRLMFQEGGVPNPRFPGVLAVGSGMEAMSDIQDIYTSIDLSTQEKLTAWMPEAAEMMSGYNNYAKAQMLRNFQDKINSRGTWLGLDTNEAAAYFQLFGFTTRQEVNGYLINDVIRESEETIEKAATDITDALTKLENKFGSPDWIEEKRRRKVLLSGFDHDPSMITAINKRVDSKQLSQAKRGSFRDTLYYKIARHYGDRNNKDFQEAMSILRASAENNQQDKAVLERFEDMLNTKINKEDL